MECQTCLALIIQYVQHNSSLYMYTQFYFQGTTLHLSTTSTVMSVPKAIPVSTHTSSSEGDNTISFPESSDVSVSAEPPEC